MASRATVAALLLLMTAAVALAATRLALREPVIDLHLSAADDGRVTTTDRWVTQQPLDWQAAAWVDGHGGGGPIDAELLIQEPDRLPRYAAWNSVIERAGAVWQALQGGRLTLIDRDGQRHPMATRARRFGELPWLLWAQLGAGGCALLLCVLVWTFADDRAAATHFLVSGIAFFVAAATSAVYASRELALPAETFRWLSRLNHLSGLLMVAAIAAQQWLYPTRLVGALATTAIYAIAFASFLSAQAQWPDAMPEVIYGPQALLMLLLIAGCLRQWRAGRTEPMKRSVLSAYLLALVAGTPIGCALVLLPQLTGAGREVSQTVMFLSFIPGYLGLAVGIARWRLFDLGRWWFVVWSWLLACFAVAAVYVLLRKATGLPPEFTVTAALAAVGWLFFPLRQSLARRFAGRELRQPLRLLGDGLAALAAEPDPARANEVWRQFLSERLATLNCHSPGYEIPLVQVLEDGHALAVPGLLGASFVLRYPDGGGRLFDDRDRRWIAVLYDIALTQAEAAAQRCRAARAEQSRLGERVDDLLQAPLARLRGSPDAECREIAEAAQQALGRLLAALDERGRTPLEDALARCEAATRTRCAAAGLRLRWEVEQRRLDHAEVGTRACVALERVLSEVVGNAVNHGRASLIEVSVCIEQERLALRIADDGGGGDPVTWLPGEGMRRVTTELADVQGEAAWQRAPGGVAVSLDIPL